MVHLVMLWWIKSSSIKRFFCKIYDLTLEKKPLKTIYFGYELAFRTIEFELQNLHVVKPTTVNKIFGKN